MRNNNLRNRVALFALEKAYTTSRYDEAIFKLYQDYVGFRNDEIFDIEEVKKKFLEYILPINPSERNEELSRVGENPFLFGMLPTREKSEKILNEVLKGEKMVFVEDAFLRCIVTFAQMLPLDQKHYQHSCGYTFDDLTAYFDATRPSRMEKVLNSDFSLTAEQMKRAQRLIKRIRECKISKYNNQPIYQPKIGRSEVPKVLVVDQSYRDFSISKGCANDSTFNRMLECAIKENPNADILIKTHPDAMGVRSAKPKCYYQNVVAHDNVYKLTDPINPISLIELVDKVYVCSSQFGFEALMCGKEVHTFGIPFYAGWGLTIDDQKCVRRTKKRTLEEVFYVAYIFMAQYINPERNEPCEIEEVLNFLEKQRDLYFKECSI